MLTRLTKANPVATARELARKWNEELLPELRSMKIFAGSGVAVSQLPAGTKVEALPQPAPAAAAVGWAYDGPFAVTWTGGNNYKVAAGYANVNGRWHEVPTASMVVSSSAFYIHLGVVYSGGYPVPGSYSSTLVMPANGALIAKIENAAGGARKITQIAYGSVVMIATYNCPETAV